MGRGDGAGADMGGLSLRGRARGWLRARAGRIGAGDALVGGRGYSAATAVLGRGAGMAAMGADCGLPCP